MLNIAKRKFDDIKFFKGNMMDFKLNKEYDIITCLFSSIGYVKTLNNFEMTVNNFYDHLKIGGVVIIEPWFDRKSFITGKPHLTTYVSKDIKIARASASFIKNNLSYMEMQYLIAETGKKIKYASDIHVMGLFEKKDMVELMKKAGFKAIYLKNGLIKDRGILIGIKE